MEIFSLVDDLSNLLASIFADYANGTEVDLSISLIIDILKLCDGICSGIFLLMSFDWIDFNHLIGSLPKNVYSGIVINRHNNSQLNVFLSAFFVGWKLKP